jgi:sigma-B regulation protein RsbU (phosphoserine phosphatase)
MELPVTVQEPHTGVIDFVPPPRIHGEVIGKLISGHAFVQEDTRIDRLADELGRQDRIFALAVVDGQGRVKGILDRRKLLDLLSRQYGRDIYRNRSAGELSDEATCFNFRRGVFSIAEIIGDELKAPRIRYYLLVDEERRYIGSFSSRDMLIYLSEITRTDIAMARALQSRFVGERLAVTGDGFSLCFASQMAKGVGGDFYYCKEFEPGKYALALCDVSGKGVAASLVTAVLLGMFGMYDFREGFPKLVAGINEYLFRTFESERFVTGVFLEYNARTREIALCDMGHSFVYLLRHGRTYRVKTAEKNLPLGFLENIEPVVDRLILQAGDGLLLPTDGIIEQTDPGGTEYGIERLSALLAESLANGPEAASGAVLDELNRYRAGESQHDDMTMLLLLQDKEA